MMLPSQLWAVSKNGIGAAGHHKSQQLQVKLSMTLLKQLEPSMTLPSKPLMPPMMLPSQLWAVSKLSSSKQQTKHPPTVTNCKNGVGAATIVGAAGHHKSQQLQVKPSMTILNKQLEPSMALPSKSVEPSMMLPNQLWAVSKLSSSKQQTKHPPTVTNCKNGVGAATIVGAAGHHKSQQLQVKPSMTILNKQL